MTDEQETGPHRFHAKYVQRVRQGTGWISLSGEVDGDAAFMMEQVDVWLGDPSFASLTVTRQGLPPKGEAPIAPGAFAGDWAAAVYAAHNAA